MSQLRCNGKVPTIVFGEVARDIVACKEVVDWLQYPVPGFEDFIVIMPFCKVWLTAGFITWYWI